MAGAGTRHRAGGWVDVPPPLNYKKAKEGRREEGKQDTGGGSAGGPVAELSLPRCAILTAVLPAPARPLDKAIRKDALFHGQHILPRDCASICPP